MSDSAGPYVPAPDESMKTDGSNVAVTAFWIAGSRALEHRKGDSAVYKDPYAESFMDEKGWEYFKEYTSYTRTHYGCLSRGCICLCLPLICCTCQLKAAWRHFVLGADNAVAGSINRRTLFFDRVCRTAAEGGVRQVVILGAGFDTRAFRLFSDMPDMHVFEVDHPNLFAYKESRLSEVGATPACQRTTVGLEYDEVADWPKYAQRVGFDPAKPTVFLAEGLTMYLQPEQETDLHTKICSVAADGSYFAGDLLQMGPRRPVLKLKIHDLVFYSSDLDKMRATLEGQGFETMECAPFSSDSFAYPGGPDMPNWRTKNTYYLFSFKKTRGGSAYTHPIDPAVMI